jgi:hypothetical protein
MSPLLGELIVAALLPYLPLDIVGVVETRESLAGALAALSPDLLLLGLFDGEAKGVAQALLALLPTMRVLAVAANGGWAWLIESNAPPLFLPELSLQDLIDALAVRFNLPPPKG